MSLYRDEGVVLRTWKLGEADRIVVIFTKGHGKVRAVAKGVRKTKSKFGARLEPTSHVALQLYEGRELDIVTQAESIDHFREVREDLDKLGRAVSMLEAVDQLAQDREPNPLMLKMLLGAMGALSADGSALVVPAFFLKLLSLEGFRPVVHQCALCGATDDLVAFDLESGGVLCRGCRRGSPITVDALALLQRVLGGQLAAVLREEPSAASHDIDVLATLALEHHLERRLRSIAVLDHT